MSEWCGNCGAMTPPGCARCESNLTIKISILSDRIRALGALLVKLDKRGGLGADVHDEIRKVLEDKT